MDAPTCTRYRAVPILFEWEESVGRHNLNYPNADRKCQVHGHWPPAWSYLPSSTINVLRKLRHFTKTKAKYIKGAKCSVKTKSSQNWTYWGSYLFVLHVMESVGHSKKVHLYSDKSFWNHLKKGCEMHVAKAELRHSTYFTAQKGTQDHR